MTVCFMNYSIRPILMVFETLFFLFYHFPDSGVCTLRLLERDFSSPMTFPRKDAPKPRAVAKADGTDLGQKIPRTKATKPCS